MLYCVDIREKKTGNTIKTILETTSHDEAWKKVNEYNKEYGIGKELRMEYPISNYFVDVFNKEI